MLYEIYAATSVGNILLLIALVYIFVQSYRGIRSHFALGLMLFSIILLFDAILSCPLVYSLFEVPKGCPAEKFRAAASVFEFVGLGVLLYIVRE